jgi:hypothetical protein
MARPRKAVRARRYHLTLDWPIAVRLEAYAETTRRPFAVAAATVITNALTRGDDEGAELRETRRQVEELTARVQALRRQLAERADRDQVEQAAPRWEWPVEVLLADVEWWDRWLPRLNELLGRTRSPIRGSERVLDDRGYVDPVGFLFKTQGHVEGADCGSGGRGFESH